MVDETNNHPASSKDLLDSLVPQKPTEFLGIQHLLGRISYADIAQLSNYEQQVYDLLKSSPQNLDGLVTFLRIQIMQGRHQKAKAVAYRIWEIGGSLNHISEKSFINDLINLGLLDMASILLKPYFEMLSANMNEYSHLFLKYAIASGNISSMEKITLLLPDSKAKHALTDFIGVYKYLSYGETFKNIQRSVISCVSDSLCSYEYNMYMDRGFADVEVLLYVGSEVSDLEHLNQVINLQIEATCASKAIKKLNNLSFIVRSIESYSPPL